MKHFGFNKELSIKLNYLQKVCFQKSTPGYKKVIFTGHFLYKIIWSLSLSSEMLG